MTGYGWIGAKFLAFKNTSSGIIGLSFPSATEDYTPIWLDQINAGKWSDKQFGIYLSRVPQGTKGAVDGGVLTLS